MDLWLICISFILITHWIADFVIQGDDVVKGTANSKYAIMHSLKYAIVFPAGAWLVSLLLGSSFDAFVLFSGVNVVTHYLIDSMIIPEATMLFRNDYPKKGIMTLAFDQVLHITIILGTFNMFLM